MSESNSTLEEMLQRRVSRRGVIAGGLGLTGTAALDHALGKDVLAPGGEGPASSGGRAAAADVPLVVDVHRHYINLTSLTKEVADGWTANVIKAYYGDYGPTARSEPLSKLKLADATARFQSYLPDAGDIILSTAAEAGINVSALLIVDSNLANSNEQIILSNKAAAVIALNSGGSAIALAGINPRRENAPALVRQCITEFGMRGLKWHPDYGHLVNDEAAYAVLKVLDELKVPLLSHTGPLPPNGLKSMGIASIKSKNATVKDLNDVCEDFPNLKVIAAHCGGSLWWQEFASYAQVRSNLYGCLAGWQVLAEANYPRFCRILREMLDVAGPDAVLFGTDYPFYSALVPDTRYIQIMRNLTKYPAGGVSFTEQEIAAVLGGNAKKVFGL